LALARSRANCHARASQGCTGHGRVVVRTPSKARAMARVRARTIAGELRRESSNDCHSMTRGWHRGCRSSGQPPVRSGTRARNRDALAESMLAKAAPHMCVPGALTTGAVRRPLTAPHATVDCARQVNCTARSEGPRGRSWPDRGPLRPGFALPSGNGRWIVPRTDPTPHQPRACRLPPRSGRQVAPSPASGRGSDNRAARDGVSIKDGGR
jgi:hypothetical protein